MLIAGQRLKTLRSKIDVLESVVQFVSATLPPPLPYHSGFLHSGFRFGRPTWKHFCLLKSVRAVSGLNACFALLPGGFSQEIAVLLRTIVECTTHIEYVLASLKAGTLEKPAMDYVERYFQDFRRNEVSDFLRPKLRQGEVHKTVGSETDQLISQTDRSNEFQSVDSAKLLSNVYLTYSNYVHSRYPEVMDLYEGQPGHFHLGGMAGTSKDEENIELIECTTVTVSNALKFSILRMDLLDKISERTDLAQWFATDEA